jgi:hypothetical protein
MKTLGRLGSILAVAAGWVLFAVRAMLDLIGYSTAPEDFEVAKTRVGQAFDLLLQAPWQTKNRRILLGQRDHLG